MIIFINAFPIGAASGLRALIEDEVAVGISAFALFR